MLKFHSIKKMLHSIQLVTVFSFLLILTPIKTCEIENVNTPNSTYFSNVELNDSFIGIIEELQTTNIAAAYIQNATYINVTLKDDKLTIFTTDRFAEYEMEETDEYVRVEIVTRCAGSEFLNRMTYRIVIEDTNNHSPEFNKEKYNYIFYDLIPSGVKIDTFSNIEVIDYDLSHRKIDFEIENNDLFNVEDDYCESYSYKSYCASLETLLDINKSFNISFEITATDDGTPSKSSNSQITVSVEKISYPSFTRNLYVGGIKSRTEVIIENGPIALEFVENLNDFDISISNEYETYFDLIVADTIKLSVKDLDGIKTIERNGNGQILLFVTAKDDASGFFAGAGVLIDLVSHDFNSGVCTVGEIVKLNWIYESQVVIDDNRIGIIEEFPTLNIEDAFIRDSPYLKAHYHNDTLTISTTENFLYFEEREEAKHLFATLITVCNKEENKLDLLYGINDINNHSPKFDEVVYEYVFYDKIPKDIDLNEFKQLSAMDVDLSNYLVSFDMEENEYLEIQNSERNPGSWKTFNVRIGLKKDLEAPFNKTFTVTATDSGTPPLNSTATVLITVLRENPPLFTKSLYNAHITKGMNIVVENGPITLQGNTKFDDLKFDIDLEYEAYFHPSVVNNDKVIIKVLKDPTGLITDDVDYVTFSIFVEGLTPDINDETKVFLNMTALVDNIEETTTDGGETTTELDITTETTEKIDEQTTTEESGTEEPIYNELNGFRYWISISKTFSILLAITAAGLTVGGIMFITRRRKS